MRMTTLRVLILGDHKVGKSAVTVRFLTKRFIGEYYSSIDHVYRSSIRQEDSMTDVEVLDTCSKTSPGKVEENRVTWADAFVIIYSICSRSSFSIARELILALSKARTSTYLPVLLLGNMRDLEHRREVGVEEGHELALEHGCQYYEVSAADSALSVSVAFQAFLREARIVQQQRAALKRRRSSLGSVSKKLGAMFGKNSSSNKDPGLDAERRRLSFTNANKDLSADAERRRLSFANSIKESTSDSDRRKSSSSSGDSDKRKAPSANGDSDKRRTPLASPSKDPPAWDAERRRSSFATSKDGSGDSTDKRKSKDSHVDSTDKRKSNGSKDSNGDLDRRRPSLDTVDKKS
ncbi:ras-related and estrogen-regulated growth inhibitor-like protein [Littorina saxatilis]|uniref:small monomeric GTPase n=1 Tax=Littorina saxatilis TaxID=31220 RepID=A0AAN9BMG2_9CAEN